MLGRLRMLFHVTYAPWTLDFERGALDLGPRPSSLVTRYSLLVTRPHVAL